jgi:hypothetical protein
MAAWAKEPGFPGRKGNGRGGSNGHYDLEAIRAWRDTAYSRPTNDGGGRKAADTARQSEAKEVLDGPEIRRRRDIADIKERESKAGILELEYLSKAGRVVDREDVERFIARTIETAKAILEELPDRIEAGLPQECDTTIRELHRRVATDVVRAALGQLAELQQEGDADDAEEDGSE